MNRMDASGAHPFQQYHGREVHGAGFVAYGDSHRGHHRHENQDHYFLLPVGATGLLACVADGLGGHAAGELASRTACATIYQVARDRFSGANPIPEFNGENLSALLLEAHGEIKAKAARDNKHAGMGTTLTLAVLTASRCWFAHVGDSRLYHVRAGTLRQVTQDDTVDQQTDVDDAPRHYLTQALGLEEPGDPLQPASGSFSTQPGDHLILCSDGLSSQVPGAQLAELLCRGASAVKTVHDLVDAALSAGGRDNITAIVVSLANQ